MIWLSDTCFNITCLTLYEKYGDNRIKEEKHCNTVHTKYLKVYTDLAQMPYMFYVLQYICLIFNCKCDNYIYKVL